MSKITFRADDELVSRLEALDTSKSEAMREALRRYLDEADREPMRSDRTDRTDSDELTIDDLVVDRVDRLLAEREASQSVAVPDVTVNVSLDGVDDVAVDHETESVGRKTAARGEPNGQPRSERDTHCAQCGETVDIDHVYCPNCGEKASHRLFCECGDEIHSDWGFCPGCGRRTPAADVLDNA